jgi:hypothetical protein
MVPPRLRVNDQHLMDLAMLQDDPAHILDDMIHATNSSTGKSIPIPAKAANETHKTLGHHKAPGAPRQIRQLQAIRSTAKNDHILLCPAISQQRWRTKCRKTVIHYMERTINSDQVLCDILRDGLTRWATQVPAPDPTTYPEQYQDLIRSQNYIGWDHLFRARWSIQWGILHGHYAQRVGLDSKLASGSVWVRKIGRKILQQWFDLWKIHNSISSNRRQSEKPF